MTEITDRPAYLETSAALEARAHDLVSRLTLDEKVGADGRRQVAFTLESVERLGVPKIRVADGPTGIRSNEGEPATVFPVGVAIASTWNPALTFEVAAAIGREALALDNRVVLAPTINIVRTPLWGRNFETYSEDPFLAGTLGIAYVEGLQSEGVGASLKHYAVNNQEENRMTVNAEVDERTLREIYLAAFEMVVKAADPWTVMASYNKIDGVYATENRRLLMRGDPQGRMGLRRRGGVGLGRGPRHGRGGQRWHRPGDARTAALVRRSAAGGGAGRRGGGKPDRRCGAEALPPDPAHRRARRRRRRTKGELRTARHRQIAERAATEAVVLLKNDGDVLAAGAFEHLTTLAVVGPNAAARRIQGGGSSQVRTDRRVSILAALTERLAGRVEVRHADGGDNEPVPPAARPAMFSPDQGRTAAGMTCAYFAERGFDAPPTHAQTERQLGKLVSHRPWAAGPAGSATAAPCAGRGWFWPERDGRPEFSVRGPGEAGCGWTGRR